MNNNPATPFNFRSLLPNIISAYNANKIITVYLPQTNSYQTFNLSIYPNLNDAL